MIETRRTTSARFGRATGRFLAGAGPRPGMALRAFADGRGLRVLLAGSGLAGLLGATACAVASVSIWLVPVYLLLVGAILATPRGPQAVSSPGRRAKTGGIGGAESGQVSGAGQAEGTGRFEPGRDARSNPANLADESDEAEPRSLRADPGSTAVDRPRKSRARSRKASKSATEPAPDSAPVTWVRVGPGQYVRSDILTQGQPPAEAPASVEVPPVATEDDPLADRPETATDTPTALVEARPAEDAPPADAPASEEPAPVVYPETDAQVAETIPTPEADAAEPLPTADEPEPEPAAPPRKDEVGRMRDESDQSLHPSSFIPHPSEEAAPEVVIEVEEYGIAPSAFAPTISEPFPAESREPDVLEPLEPISAEPECHLGLTENLGANAPVSGQADARPDGRRSRSRTFTRFVPRRIAQAFPTAEPRALPSWRGARGPSRPRAVVRCPSARESRRADAARRASGRTSHVRRDWRARSPPRCS